MQTKVRAKRASKASLAIRLVIPRTYPDPLLRTVWCFLVGIAPSPADLHATLVLKIAVPSDSLRQLEEWTAVATTTASSAAGRATGRRWPSWLWRWDKRAHSLQSRLKATGAALQCPYQMKPPPRPPWGDSDSDAEGKGGSHRWGFPSTLRRRGERREPRWEFGELNHALTRVLRHKLIVIMREDNAALLEDPVKALQHSDPRREGLGVKEVEETVRRSHRDGRPRFQILPSTQGWSWIRATNGHTFRQMEIEQQQNLIYHALVQHCRRDWRRNSVSLSELVRVMKEKGPSITEEEVLRVLEHETHRYDERLIFKEVYEGAERRFRAPDSSNRYKCSW